MNYGEKRDYRKIDIFSRSDRSYLASTNWARTCREAKERYAAKHNMAASDLVAFYSRA